MMQIDEILILNAWLFETKIWKYVYKPYILSYQNTQFVLEIYINAVYERSRLLFNFCKNKY